LSDALPISWVIDPSTLALVTSASLVVKDLSTVKLSIMTRVQIISLPASPDSTDAASFEWRLPPDLESEITTLAALCHVKQQQREPIPRSTNRGDDEIDDGDPAEDEEGTDMFSSLSLSDDGALKGGFLDRLAELLCYRKSPALITATGLMYDDEETTVVAARNSANGCEPHLLKEKTGYAMT
jgi:hypothetical protein